MTVYDIKDQSAFSPVTHFKKKEKKKIYRERDNILILIYSVILFEQQSKSCPIIISSYGPPSDPSAGTCFIWLRHDSTEPNEYFKYSSSAARLLYTLPTSHTDDPGLQFQNFQVETTSSQ